VIVWRDGKPYVRTHDAARMLAGPRASPEEIRRAYDRIRNWTRRGLLHPTNDGTSRMGRLGCLYSWDEIAAVAGTKPRPKAPTRAEQ
jgi:hypothetical protein